MAKAKNIKAKAKNLEASVEISSRPSHVGQIPRLARVKGQIQGIEKMINEKRYCPDIIIQIKAARAALEAAEAEIFRTHLRSCVRNALTSSDMLESDTKIQEIMKMVYSTK